MQIQGSGRGQDDPFHAYEELALAGGEGDRLPWLEGDEEPEDHTVDTGRVMAFALVGLLILVLLLGSLWYAFSDHVGSGTQDDGTTIEAPDEPYKTRPENPGGREVEGTGDAAFRVAEGQAAGGKIEDIAPVPPAPAQEGAPPPPPQDLSGVGIQVGAYSTRASAEAGWAQLIRRYESLQGRQHRIVQGLVDNAVIYRLQVVAGDEDSADLLCEALKGEGGDCQVKR